MSQLTETDRDKYTPLSRPVTIQTLPTRQFTWKFSYTPILENLVSSSLQGEATKWQYFFCQCCAVSLPQLFPPPGIRICFSPPQLFPQSRKYVRCPPLSVYVFLCGVPPNLQHSALSLILSSSLSVQQYDVMQDKLGMSLAKFSSSFDWAFLQLICTE